MVLKRWSMPFKPLDLAKCPSWKQASILMCPSQHLLTEYPGNTLDRKPGKKPVIPGDVETQMVKKVMGLAEQEFGISSWQMLGRAATVCSQLKLKKKFKDGVPGMDWLAGLRRRHPLLVLRKPEKLATVRSRMLNPIKVGRYFKDLYEYSKDMSPTEIWNMDETNLNMEHRPVKVLASVGARSVPGRTGNTREGVTVLPCVNTAGEKNPPLLIVRGKTERFLRSFNTHEGPPSAKWTYQPKGWMIDSIGVEWFREIVLPNCGTKRPQLIILDSHHSHETLGLLELAQENNIMIMTMPAHTTHYLCPLDRCVFGPFKREYDAVCSEFMSTNTDNIVNKLSFAKLMRTAYDKSFKSANIVSGFEATGIVDWNPLAIPVSAFAAASAFDNPDIELDEAEKELPGDNHPFLWLVHLYSDLIEYTLYEKDVTWNEAAAICAQDKAHLLSINSREKFDLIQEFKQGPWQSIA
ncbi:Hypothetical predicted protein [Mytilus galloprovincialis]|nr:Hypothetical predicted protein [Mytilus galloprovincialis]